MTMDYSPWVEKENLSFLKVAISPKPEKSHPPKLVCMYGTSRLIGQNGQNGQGKLAIFESSNISETGEVTPTKIGIYACYINTYLHDFFEPILSN